jgi:hypothetical protein
LPAHAANLTSSLPSLRAAVAATTNSQFARICQALHNRFLDAQHSFGIAPVDCTHMETCMQLLVGTI